MGTVTYPKKSHTVGEQKTVKFAPEAAAPEFNRKGSGTSYKAKGHAGPNTRHTSRESSRAPFLNGGTSAAVTVTYPAKGHAKFGSEQTRNTLKPPMSGMPKEA